MKYSNTVEYNISTKLDASGLTKLQSQIKQVELSLQRMGDKEFLNPSRVAEARKQLEGLDTALTKSFNSSLGILDLSKLRSELQASKVTADGLGTAFNMAGSQGTAAMTGLIQQIGNFNGGIERTSSTIDKMFVTFQNTFRWGMISSFFSQFMNAIHNSVDYVKELDDSLTQIMLVTDYNRDSMNEYAKSANEAAKALSMSTTGMTNASLVFAQQGYDLNQSQELATLSAKVANASQQDTATTSDQITAYMNAYGLEGSISELTQAMDNWALIANISAADVSELAQASQRAASMANAVGVSGEALAAQIATIESVTREAPEQIGNGLKTLYARFSDISLGGEDEDGIGLGKVTATLEGIGVKVLDQFGNIRTMDDIMEDLMVIWDDLDSTTKTAAAQALAGKYQVNRFEALMENSDMYRQYKNATGENATGTLDQMNQEYVESLAGRTQKLSTTLEGLFNDVFTTDMVYPLIDRLTDLANATDTVFKAIGDGPTILLTLASAFGQLFSTNIARAANDFIANQQLQEVRKNNIANVGNTLDQLGLGKTEMGQYIKTMASNAPKMNQDQYDQYIAALNDWANTTSKLASKEEELQGTIDALNMVYGTKLKTPNAANMDERGKRLDLTAAEERRADLTNKDLSKLISKEDFTEEAKSLMELTKAFGSVETAYENFKNGIGEESKGLEIMSQAAKIAVDKMKQLSEAGLLNAESAEEVEQAFNEVTEAFLLNDKSAEGLEQELDNIVRRFATLAEKASTMDPASFKKWILSGIEEAKRQEQELYSLRNQNNQNKENAGGIIDNIVSQNAIEGVVKVTSSLGQLAGAISTIQNLGQILSNDQIGPFDKFVQVLTSLGILIPTIVMSVKEFAEGIKLLKEAKVAENIVEAISQGLIISDIRLKKQQLTTDAELIAMNKALTIAEGEAGTAGIFFAGVLTTIKGAAASALTALGPIGLAIAAIGAIAAAVGVGVGISNYIEDLQETQAQQEALNEITQQTSETVNKLNESAPVLNELYEAYKETGEASDEFKQSLADQAELLGINDAALLISQGKYEELKAKIDEATQSIYDNNAALQQIKLDKINSNEVVNELTDDQKERYGVTYHQEEGITGLNGGTAEKGLVNKIDQTPYELVKAAQQDIEKQQEKINSLTQERNNLVKEGLTATGEASQKIASDITKVDEELAIAAQKLAESKEFTENHSEVLEATEAIRDNALNQELNNSDSIFKTGTYEEIKDFISAQQGVSSSNVDELIQKYADLTGNIDAATEATLKLRNQQIRNNELITDGQTGINYRAGEKGKFLIDEIGKQQDWSNEDKAKISSMIDWTDPDIDQKVIELLERIQQGLNDGLSLDEALKVENPEDIKAAIAEMEPRDSDLEVGPYREMAEYLREFAGELEGIPEEVGQNSEMLQDFTEAILRYDDAIQDADENLSDWKDILLNTGEAAEDDAVYLEDLMEAFEGMRDMIGDLLDMDVSDLSQQFMQNSDVLDILDKAIYGVGEEADLAYDQLNYLAQLDMAGLIDWTDGIDEELADWDNALPSLEANIDSLSARATELGDNASYAMGVVQDILGGSIPGPDLDLSAFIAGLEQMVNDGEMSVAQAMAAIDGAGYSAEVTQGEAEGTNEEGHINAIPHLTEGVTVNSQITGTVSGNAGGGTGAAALKAALGGGGTQTVSWQGQVQGVEWTMEEAKEQTATTANATGVKYKANTGGGSGAGQIHFTNVKAKPTGSTKRNTSGNGNHSRPSSGGGSGGKSCFVAGTLISTSFGYKPIELIKPNDLILSYNELLHQNEYSKVIQTMIHDTIEPIYTLYIKNEQLKVTGIHRFLIIDNIINPNPQWICAENLRVGQWVLFADGTWHVIHKIEVSIEHQTVYNFEVSHNHNYYVGRNQILAHNKGGGGKKGGSGSGSKAKTIEQKEKKEHKKDYYEEVNNQLEKTDKILSKIQKEQDRLMGDKAIANQNKQIKLLQKEIALNKDKLDIQKQELADVNALIKKNDERAEQAAKAQGIAASVPEIQLDEDGIVSNYEQISAKIDEIHNQLIDKYNAAAERSDEELTKEIAKSIEKFDEYGENLLKDIQRHNKLQSEIEETNNTLEELDDTIEDIRIDAYKAYQEAQDNFKELKENAAEMAAIFQDFNEEGFLTKWSLDDTPIGDMTKAMYELDNIYNVSKEDANDFYDSIIAQKEKEKQKATDPDEKAAIQSSIDFFEGQKANLTSDTLMNGVVGRAIHDVQQLQGWIDGTNTEPNPFGENTAALRETYEEAYKRATDTYKDWRETVQDLRDAVIDAYDEQEDALERNLDEYDRIIDHLERINDTYTLYYGEDSYDGVLQIMDRQGATMQQHLNDLTDAFIYWQKKYQEALENGDEKLIQSIREKMEDAEDAMYDKAEEIAEHWVERYEKAVDASIQKIDIKLWGGGPGQMDLEDQSTIWELQKDYMDTYKDDVEKAYEVDKLRSKYINLLNDAQGMSLQTQNKIRAQMQEQLALLDGQKTVSEYDVKLANAKLEILQKQIALEDAQRNKNKMQLRRDTQGNYRYVYTADQGDVQQAQDELNESQFDAYEMTKEQTIANNDRAINLYQDYMNKMRDIANKYKDDEVARNAAMKALSEEYGKLLEALEEDFKDTTNGMYEVLMWMIDKGTQDTSTAAMDMLDQLYDKNGEVKENTGNAWRDLATQITKDVLPNINEAVAQGFADINAQASTLKEQMTGDNGVLTKIGSSTDTLKDSIDKAKEATTQWAIETENLFNAFSADNPKVQEAMKQLQAMEAQLKANEQATSALATKYREANDLLTAKTAEAANYKRALENPNEYEYKDGKVVKKEPPKTSNNGGNNSGAKSFSNGSIVGFRGSYSENSWGEGRWGNMYSGRANAVRISSFSRRSGYGPRNVHLETLGGGHLGWVTQSQLFDTGGYTGKWNSNEGMPNSKNGKLAVLHQKELVLNERDTENILTAVSMIRQISTSMQGALSNISAAASNNVSSNYNPITEQRVEIQASFPNATDADDIRQALIGLSDRAYQYAHRVI